MLLKQHITEYLNTYKWDLHLTLTFRHLPPDSSTAIKQVKLFLQKLKHKFPRVSFAGIILFNNDDDHRDHIHLLLTSNQTFPITLLEIPPDALSQYWRPGGARMTNCFDWIDKNETICNYLTKRKNMNFND